MRLTQEHNEAGDPLCPACTAPITHNQLFVEVRQRSWRDSDPKVGVHLGCLSRLGEATPEPSAPGFESRTGGD